MRDDMTDDVGRNTWLPPEGWVDVEVVKMIEGISKQNNPKYTVDFASAVNPGEGLQQDLTNIPGKRWLVRSLIEACGIVPETVFDEETGKERKIYNWEISDIEGKTVSGKIIHEPNDWRDRNNIEHHDKKAKFVQFKNLGVN